MHQRCWVSCLLVVCPGRNRIPTQWSTPVFQFKGRHVEASLEKTHGIPHWPCGQTLNWTQVKSNSLKKETPFNKRPWIRGLPLTFILRSGRNKGKYAKLSRIMKKILLIKKCWGKLIRQWRSSVLARHSHRLDSLKFGNYFRRNSLARPVRNPTIGELLIHKQAKVTITYEWEKGNNSWVIADFFEYYLLPSTEREYISCQGFGGCSGVDGLLVCASPGSCFERLEVVEKAGPGFARGHRSSPKNWCVEDSRILPGSPQILKTSWKGRALGRSSCTAEEDRFFVFRISEYCCELWWLIFQTMLFDHFRLWQWRSG